MHRSLLLAPVLAIALAVTPMTASAATAELPDLESVTEAPKPAAYAADSVPGESVVDLADFISAYLAETGGLPDWAQVQMADGSLRRVSAAEVFALFARTAYLWQVMDGLPEMVQLTPAQVRGPAIDAQDLPADVVDPEVGVQVPTDAFLNQCEATVSWVDRLRVVPTAVWVDGQRLSAAQYLAGLAICIQYAYHEGGLEDYIFLPNYRPPSSWVASGARATAPPASQLSEEEAEWEGSEVAQPNAGQAVASVAPLASDETSPPAAPEPHLEMIPEPGATVSGTVDIVPSYTGPAPQFVVIAIDGRTRAIMNVPPFGYRWDTCDVGAGAHTMTVRVLGKDDVLLAAMASVYVVEPRTPAGEAPADDL